MDNCITVTCEVTITIETNIARDSARAVATIVAGTIKKHITEAGHLAIAREFERVTNLLPANIGYAVRVAHWTAKPCNSSAKSATDHKPEAEPG